MPTKDVLNGIKTAVGLSGITKDIGSGIRDIRQELERLGVEIAPENQIIRSWHEVFEAIDNKTYRRKFKVGDCILCDFGKVGCIYMQIAAFNKDRLSDGNGYAAITWIAKYCLATKREMNESGYWLPIISNKGGWEKSDMRSALGEVKYEIEDSVYSRLAYVKKNNEKNDTEDRLWILSADEYKEYFNHPNIRFSSNESFWLRDANGRSSFLMASSSGNISPVLSNVKDGVLVGFCTN